MWDQLRTQALELSVVRAAPASRLSQSRTSARRSRGSSLLAPLMMITPSVYAFAVCTADAAPELTPAHNVQRQRIQQIGRRRKCEIVSRRSGYLKRRVAIAIQRGNAALDRAGLQLSRNSYGAAVASGMVVAGNHCASKDSAQRSCTRSRSHSAKPSLALCSALCSVCPLLGPVCCACLLARCTLRRTIKWFFEGVIKAPNASAITRTARSKSTIAVAHC
jgi:hypothetical protein